MGPRCRESARVRCTSVKLHVHGREVTGPRVRSGCPGPRQHVQATLLRGWRKGAQRREDPRTSPPARKGRAGLRCELLTKLLIRFWKCFRWELGAGFPGQRTAMLAPTAPLPLKSYLACPSHRPPGLETPFSLFDPRFPLRLLWPRSSYQQGMLPPLPPSQMKTLKPSGALMHLRPHSYQWETLGA